MTSQRLRHAAAVRWRAMLALALAVGSAGLCGGCIGTVPVVTLPPPTGLVPSEQEEERALEPDHWGDE